LSFVELTQLISTELQKDYRYQRFPISVITLNKGTKYMKTKMTMIYWKTDKFWLGKLQEYPEIMTQGETLEELEENVKDAYSLMVMDNVPEEYQTKEIVL
jgi:predicted RNase H-like HicB family nuclease